MGKIIRSRRNTGRQRSNNVGGRNGYTKLDFYARNSAAGKLRFSNTTFSIRQIIAIIVFAMIVGTGVGAWMALKPTQTASVLSAPNDTLSAQFGLCDGGGGGNCVIDGDTIRFEGEKIRIVGLDTPETHPPSCAREADLGRQSTLKNDN